MIALLEALAQGHEAPPRADLLVPEYLAAVDQLHGERPLIIGGKSMGGRVASMVADDLHAAGKIVGLLCLGYPFHPPGKPGQLRTKHLVRLKTPTLICQGTGDPLGTRQEVSGYELSERAGTTPILVLDLLKHIDRRGLPCKLTESVSALKCILENHVQSGADLKLLYADEITARKYRSSSGIRRSIGSTLLVKGLKFDHVIILRGAGWQEDWGNHKDLYVALTRGSRTITLIEMQR